MWERFNEQFALGASVVSHSMIAASGQPEFDEESGEFLEPAAPERGIVLSEKFPRRGPVLIDEAHNFRNRNQRWRGLTEFLESGDHKLVLLSATPQNLGPLDVYRQLRLFLDQRDHGLPIEPVDLEEYFANARRWLDYRTENANYLAEYREWERDSGGLAPPIPPSQPQVPFAEVTEVLKPVFVRRRRRDIAELYGDSATIDGQPVRFPKPTLENVEYRLDRVYAQAGTFEDLTCELVRHRAARYHISRYLRPECADKKEYEGLRRARDRVAGLTRVLLLKRLESSVAAFASTLESLVRSNRNFRAALDEGYVPVGTVASRLLSDREFSAEETLAILAQEESGRSTAFPAADFETGQWTEDLDSDFQVLSGLLDRVRRIVPDHDDKLAALRKFLKQPEVESGKILIFSEAETTINYLYEQLNPGGKDPSVARLSGANRSEAAAIVTRFSPGPNLAPSRSAPGPPIRVLLATDVVSEGQNLQDCGRVLNYDLHWNPVRLIQRFGRVDRIGSPHAQIFLHSMWPDLEVDAGLDLTGRLGARIQLFHDLIGLDNRLLSSSERLNERAMYRIYSDRELPDEDDSLDEVSLQQRSSALLQRIQREDPDLWDLVTNLPDGIRSALAVSPDADDDAIAIRNTQPALISPGNAARSAYDDPVAGETLVLLAAGQVKGCYAVGTALEPRAISPGQFAAAAKCGPGEEALELPSDTGKRVMAAYRAFRRSLGSRLGRARRPRDTRVRRYVSRQLTQALRAASGPEEAAELEDLRGIFGGSVSSPVETALREIMDLGLEGPALLIRLRALRRRFRLAAPSSPGEAEDAAPQVVRIVCSDGLE